MNDLSQLAESLADMAHRYVQNPWPTLVAAALGVGFGLLVIWMLHITSAAYVVEAMQ